MTDNYTPISDILDQLEPLPATQISDNMWFAENESVLQWLAHWFNATEAATPAHILEQLPGGVAGINARLTTAASGVTFNTTLSGLLNTGEGFTQPGVWEIHTHKDAYRVLRVIGENDRTETLELDPGPVTAAHLQQLDDPAECGNVINPRHPANSWEDELDDEWQEGCGFTNRDACNVAESLLKARIEAPDEFGKVCASAATQFGDKPQIWEAVSLAICGAIQAEIGHDEWLNRRIETNVDESPVIAAYTEWHNGNVDAISEHTSPAHDNTPAFFVHGLIALFHRLHWINNVENN